MEAWNYQKSKDLYGIATWGDGYFDVNAKGNVTVRPDKLGVEIDLHQIITSLTERGIDVPVLLRFDTILRDRVQRIQSAFDNAISEEGYKGSYRCAYPIKVNQQRHVVDILREAGRASRLGLEVGSKPELIAVLAIHDTPDSLLLCNGYKDSEYIELALLANKVGRRSIIIIEQLYEIDTVLELTKSLGIDAEIGIRMKPAHKGSGRWEDSSGDKAKFGLSTHEMMIAIERLQSAGKEHLVKLLHFHIGSQITSIKAIKVVMREASRMYTELKKVCPSLCFLDVGGGLAVDYDGSRTNFESSMNYSLEEYARDIVSQVKLACDEAGIAEPDIISESGRALVAHHAVLVAQTIDVAPMLDAVPNVDKPPTEHETLTQMYEMYGSLSVKNCQEVLNDSLVLRDEIIERFNSGDLTLQERAYADKLLKHMFAKIKRESADLKYLPEDLEKLDEELHDIYFANFSVFQSLPDSWAIDHLFPVMPIHLLNEEPTRRAIIADVSCDSDGKLDRFIDLKDVKHYVPLHPVKRDRPYYFGVFLVGAYQEILGDLHNLFGDTNAVHIDVSEDGQVDLTHVVEGDTVREVLSYVQYDHQDLIERLRQSIEKALRRGSLTNEESARLQKRFKESLEGYTYLRV